MNTSITDHSKQTVIVPSKVKQKEAHAIISLIYELFFKKCAL